MFPKDLRQFARTWRAIADPSGLEKAVIEFPDKVAVKERLKGNRHTGGVLIRTSAFRTVVRIGGHRIGVEMGLFDPRKDGVTSRPLTRLASFWTECLRQGLFEYLQQGMAQKLVARREASEAASLLGQAAGGWEAWKDMEAATWSRMSDWVRGDGYREAWTRGLLDQWRGSVEKFLNSPEAAGIPRDDMVRLIDEHHMRKIMQS